MSTEIGHQPDAEAESSRNSPLPIAEPPAHDHPGGDGNEKQAVRREPVTERDVQPDAKVTATLAAVTARVAARWDPTMDSREVARVVHKRAQEATVNGGHFRLEGAVMEAVQQDHVNIFGRASKYAVTANAKGKPLGVFAGFPVIVEVCDTLGVPPPVFLSSEDVARLAALHNRGRGKRDNATHVCGARCHKSQCPLGPVPPWACEQFAVCGACAGGCGFPHIEVVIAPQHQAVVYLVQSTVPVQRACNGFNMFLSFGSFLAEPGKWRGLMLRTIPSRQRAEQRREVREGHLLRSFEQSSALQSRRMQYAAIDAMVDPARIAGHMTDDAMNQALLALQQRRQQQPPHPRR